MSAVAAHYMLLRRLRQLLQHRSGYGVVYLFSDYPLANQWLQAELDAHLRMRSMCLQHVAPSDAAMSPSEVLQPLLSGSTVAPMPVWLDIGLPDLDWDFFRTSVLARLNENRTVLSRNSSFIFVLLPSHFEATAAQIAPDLWSVRSASYTVAPWLGDGTSVRAHVYAPSPALEARGHSGILPSLVAQEQRWLRLWSVWSVDRKQHLSPVLAWQLVDQWREQQRPDRAQTFAAQALQLSRQLLELTGEAPQSVRDLSVSLDKVGNVALDLGQLEEARSAYCESLQLRRQLLELTGEAPQSLRDLSVSLDNVGDVARDLGQLEEARSAYQESLRLSRQLLELTGDAPQSLRDLSVSLDNVGDVARDLGHLEEARGVYRESLQLRCQLLELTGEAPQSLRDLSVSLNKAGDVARDLGQLEEARSAYQESLRLSRQLLELTGDAPQSLRDLSVSLDNVGDVARDLGHLEEARRAYQESLGLIQRLRTVLASDRSLAPAQAQLEQKLRDLCPPD
jgi:tetratricopeptide (TPR) repeat protein